MTAPRPAGSPSARRTVCASGVCVPTTLPLCLAPAPPPLPFSSCPAEGADCPHHPAVSRGRLPYANMPYGWIDCVLDSPCRGFADPRAAQRPHRHQSSTPVPFRRSSTGSLFWDLAFPFVLRACPHPLHPHSVAELLAVSSQQTSSTRGQGLAGLTCQCVASPAAGAGPGGVHKCRLSRRACKPMDNEPEHQEPRPGVTVTSERMDHVSSLSLRTEITAIRKLPCHITPRLNSVTHTCKYIQNVNKEDIKDYFNNFLFN